MRYLMLRYCVPECDKIVHSGEHRRRISQFLRDEEAENKEYLESTTDLRLV